MKKEDIIGALARGNVLHGRNNNYRIIKTLGQGAFGITYLANIIERGESGDVETEAMCAIKEFFMKDFNGRSESTVTTSSKDGAFGYYKEKFVKEAKNLEKLQHPHIIKVMELFEENSTAYYVMEYIDGGSLDDLIDNFNKLSESQTIDYAKQIGSALEYMHSNNMLHLDLKPNNVMVRENGDAVLIDFGLSKQFDANGNPETSTKVGHGTPGYSPLEQANLGKDIYSTLPASMDVYALGATMFKMITGNRPPEASIILNDGFPANELEQTDCSPELARIIEKCMAPRKSERYQNVAEVIEALPEQEEEKTNYLGSKGFYYKAVGEREYGTFEIIKVPVTDCIRLPKSVIINLKPNNTRGVAFDFALAEEGAGYSHNNARIWHNGKLIIDQNFPLGIPQDVQNFLIEHGFLSTEHWEQECTTSPIGNEFGFEVGIKLTDDKGTTLERRVNHAHPKYHNILLSEVVKLIGTTSLKKYSDAAKKKVLEFQSSAPTRELIYTIPDNTSVIEIRYRAGGIVGSTLPDKFIRIGDNKSARVNFEYSFNKAEFKELAEGLRAMQLRSKDAERKEPPTGVVYPTLTVTLYDNDGKKLKSFYSQGSNNEMLGNVSIAVEDLRKRISNISPYFKSRLKEDIKEESTTESKGPALVLCFLVSIVVALLALPCYFFVKPSDSMYIWMWSALGLAELTGGFIFNISYGCRNSDKVNNFEAFCYIIAITSLIAYAVMWIIQMCKWWA